MKIRSRDSAGTESIIEIEALQRIDLTPSEKLVIKVDISGVPPAQVHVYMRSIKDFFELKFNNDIIVVPSTFTFQVLP
jgi:hypothetical protein